MHKSNEEYCSVKEVFIESRGYGEYLVAFKLKEGSYKDNIIAYVEDDNIHIVDSYKITHTEDMYDILGFLRYDIGTKLGYYYQRSMGSWLTEWRAHNVLYRLGFMRDRTGSVDLYEKESKFVLFMYKILASLYK